MTKHFYSFKAERSRKQAENDLMEANERSTMLHTQNTGIVQECVKASLTRQINSTTIYG